MTATLGIKDSSSSIPLQPKGSLPNQIPSFAMIAHIINMIVDDNSVRSQRIPLHNRHIMISIAQLITFPMHSRLPQLPIPLIPPRTHIPLLPIENNEIIHLIPLIRIMRIIAELIRKLRKPMCFMRPRPALAHTTTPIEFHIQIETAVFDAGFEAGVFVVEGFGAEVLGDEGGVEVGVVVVKLEIVGFVVLGVVEVHAVAAVAEGAGEKVAVVGAGVLVGEASDFAGVGVFFCYLGSGDGGDAGAKAEDSEGELLEAMHC